MVAHMQDARRIVAASELNRQLHAALVAAEHLDRLLAALPKSDARGKLAADLDAAGARDPHGDGGPLCEFDDALQDAAGVRWSLGVLIGELRSTVRKPAPPVG